MPRSRSRSPARRGGAATTRSRSRSYERTADPDLLDRQRRRWQSAVRYLRPVDYERFTFRVDRSQTTSTQIFQTYDIIQQSNDEHQDMESWLYNFEGGLHQQLVSLWSTQGAIKWQVRITGYYSKPTDPSVVVPKELYSKLREIIAYSDITDTVSAAMMDVLDSNEHLTGEGSGWVLEEIGWKNRLKVYRMAPRGSVSGAGASLFRIMNLYGSSYLPTPKWLQHKGCVINVKNKGNECFRYALEAAWLYRNSRNAAQQLRQWENPMLYDLAVRHFNFDDLVFPVHAMEMDKFEKRNPGIAVHIWFVTDRQNEVIPVRCPKWLGDDNTWHIHLLVITQMNEDGSQDDYHYCFIKDLDKLLSSNAKNKGHRKFFCTKCSQPFNQKKFLDMHTPYCLDKNPPKKANMPNDRDYLSYYRNFHKEYSKPAVIYADFEAFAKPVEHTEDDTKTEASRLSNHVASGYCYYVVFRGENPSNNKLVKYTTKLKEFNDEGKTEVVSHFLASIKREAVLINRIIEGRFCHQAHLGDEYKAAWEEEENCCICHFSFGHTFMNHWAFKPFSKSDSFEDKTEYFAKLALYKDRDYIPSNEEQSANFRHWSQKDAAWWPHIQFNNYRGAAHRGCVETIPTFHEKKGHNYGGIPVVFHNLSGYDAHLIIAGLGVNDFRNDTIVPSKPGDDNYFHCIPETSDKFKSFGFSGLTFIDSFRFLSSSLDTIVKTLKEDDFIHVKAHSQFDEATSKLFRRKGVFPYDWFDNPSKLDVACLPPLTHNNWYNKLYDQIITDDEYRFAEDVWTATECKTMRDYHDQYLVQDVLLLADCMENFRRICMQENGLEPFHYITLPSYASDACMKISDPVKVEYSEDPLLMTPFSIELVRDYDLYASLSRMVRGGVSMCPGRHSFADNQFVENDDNGGTQLSNFIQYWDANNLYGFAMCRPLPFGNVEVINVDDPLDFMSIHVNDPITCDTGYIFEIDAEFPKECHDFLRDFPPAPTHGLVSTSMCSPYYNDLNDRFKTRHDTRTPKLLCTLLPRKCYRVHYLNLKLYMDLGMKVTKVHSIISFDQSLWLAKYINHNTAKRAVCKSDMEKDFYKLMNNAVYGRFIMNKDKFRTSKALINFDGQNKRTWEPFMTDWNVINEGLVFVNTKEGKTEYNSAIAVGAVILEHAKWLMYHFYYQVLKPIFSTRMRLLITDTDSLVIEFKSRNLYNELAHNGVMHWFDFSDWPCDNSYHGACYHSPDCGCFIKGNPITCNKKVIGKFKDEDAEKRRYIAEVFAIRSKMYYLKYARGKGDKAVAKGINRAQKRKLKEQAYRDCFLHEEGYLLQKGDMVSLRTNGSHNISTTSTSKLLLSPMDSKVYMLNHEDTLPYGHYRIPQLQQSQ